MERLSFLMQLKPGMEAEYERRHAELWPEMRDALVQSGFRNYSPFRRGSAVIGYAECIPDVATVMATMQQTEVNSRWSLSFADIIESMTDETGNLIRYSELWHLQDS